MSITEWANEANARYDIGKPIWKPASYRCHLAILREDDGSFSVLVLNLPGTGSCGPTEESAINRTREAVAGVIETHKELNEEIPWQDPLRYTIPEGAKQKWILVNV